VEGYLKGLLKGCGKVTKRSRFLDGLGGWKLSKYFASYCTNERSKAPIKGWKWGRTLEEFSSDISLLVRSLRQLFRGMANPPKKNRLVKIVILGA
jgi:hypothetical protein